MEQIRIKEIIEQMTLEEKAGLCSGGDFWHTQGIERLSIPALMLTDGPFGLRKQNDKADHLGINESIEAVSFPAGCATAASFDRKLLIDLGQTLGNECQAEDVAILLGPAMNIKRSPLCGRNFEYYSEDPFLSTEIAGAYIKGLQSKNIGASPKHFYGNNMEERRMTSSSQIDERTAREIYLASFEGAVKNGKPWTIMCAYNKVNGTYVAEDKVALTDILREEWGFDGFVVSDWGAVNDRVPDLVAGLDLEMPSSQGYGTKKIVESVQNGKLDESILNRACERILDIIFRYKENRDEIAVFDRDADHEKARKYAEECIVLLKNDGILPLKEGSNVAFIGKYASKPRYQGGGSSHINSSKVTSAIEAASEIKNISYAQGFDDVTDVTDQALLEEAIDLAKRSEVAVIFAGLPDLYESEGYDRTHMKLPPNQETLIEKISKVQKNVVIVLHNGSPVEMPWIDNVKGVLESYLGGQAVGGAQVDVLFGRVNPSGKLAETFPLRLEDNPSYLGFKVEKGCVNYREGIFTGYRYYDARKMEVLFPFGHGLSYTTYEYSNLQFDKECMDDTEYLRVSVDVENTGEMTGKEVVQLYVSPQNSTMIRPVKELKGFEKISLNPGEKKTVVFTLDKRAFAYWDVEVHDWYVERGDYKILIGTSSREIKQEKTILVKSTTKVPTIYTKDSPMLEIMSNPDKAEIIQSLMSNAMGDNSGQVQSEISIEAISDTMIQAMMASMPLRSMIAFGGGTEESLTQLLELLNK